MWNERTSEGRVREVSEVVDASSQQQFLKVQSLTPYILNSDSILAVIGQVGNVTVELLAITHHKTQSKSLLQF
jgi:hypothetical protein